MLASGSRVFLGCLCLSLGSFRRAAPRAVGSVSRVGLLARPSSAGVGSGGRRRGSFGRVPAALFLGAAPARTLVRRDAWGGGSGHAWFVLERSAKQKR